MTLSSLAGRAAKMAADNSPLILTAIGVAGTISTAVLSARAGARATFIMIGEDERRVNQMRHEIRSVPAPTLRETVELTWKEFIPPVITGVGTIACIVCANRIGTRRTAAMAAAFAVSQETLTEYRSKVIEKIGENKERVVRDEIAQEQVRRRPASELSIVEGATDVLCYEQFTGRYFASSMETLKSAQNSVNHMIVSGDNSASLSDFYDRVGLNHTQLSDEVGWNVDNMLELTFSTTMDELDRPVLAFDYKVVPVRNYFRIH